jgi:hypothetical protein
MFLLSALKNFLAVAAPPPHMRLRTDDSRTNVEGSKKVNCEAEGKATEVNDLINLDGDHGTLVTVARAAPLPRTVAQQQLHLLGIGNNGSDKSPGAQLGSGAAAAAATGTHALANAPLFSAHVLRGSPSSSNDGGEGNLDVAEDVFGCVPAGEGTPMMSTTSMLTAAAITPPAQYGLLGLLDPEALALPFGYGAAAESAHSKMLEDSRLFMNTNVPFSTFICGVQGSGKSHTMSCLIGTRSLPHQCFLVLCAVPAPLPPPPTLPPPHQALESTPLG